MHEFDAVNCFMTVIRAAELYLPSGTAYLRDEAEDHITVHVGRLSVKEVHEGGTMRFGFHLMDAAFFLRKTRIAPIPNDGRFLLTAEVHAFPPPSAASQQRPTARGTRRGTKPAVPRDMGQAP
jgi:hypothetical protein